MQNIRFDLHNSHFPFILTFYRETPANDKGQGHSSTLWSIDLTGFNERKIDTPQDGSDPSWSNLLQ